MSFEIPGPQSRQFQQYNRSNLFGTLDSTFNIDLNTNQGAVRTTGMIKAFDEDTESDFEELAAVEFYGNDVYLLSANNVYKSATPFPSSGFTKVATPASVEVLTADMKEFNDYVYVSTIPQLGGTMFVYKYDGSSWTTVGSIGSADGNTLLEKFGDSIYVVLNFVEVRAISKADVISTTTGTLDLALPTTYPDGYSITMLKAANDKLWIGLTGAGGNKGLVYTWDGSTQNTPTSRFDLDYGVVAGIIKDGIPYVVDAIGRLMRFNGASFTEVAKLPIGPYPLEGNEQEGHFKWIHPNGITIKDNEILINIANDVGGLDTTPEKLPSGIWAYNETNGLYHKHSVTASDSGSKLDYGQNQIDRAGALKYIAPSNGSTSANGDIVAGGVFYPGSSGTRKYAVYYNDVLDTTQKYGYFTTIKIFGNIEESWSKVYATYKKLLNSGDKIVVKYRTEEDVPTQADITWVDTDTFTTTDNVSAYAEGDEVEIVRGEGGGKCAHISSISEAGGTYTVNLDDTFTGVTTNTAIARFSKWVKAGETTFDDGMQWRAFGMPVKNRSPWVQFKVCMQFTGENELYKLKAINESTVKE
jgi:hypothetical protein